MDMTREEALKIIDQDNCFGCVDVEKHCDKCGLKQAREILLEALDKLSAYENAYLIEIKTLDDYVDTIDDLYGRGYDGGELQEKLRDLRNAIDEHNIPRFEPKGDSNES